MERSDRWRPLTVGQLLSVRLSRPNLAFENGQRYLVCAFRRIVITDSTGT